MPRIANEMAETEIGAETIEAAQAFASDWLSDNREAIEAGGDGDLTALVIGVLSATRRVLRHRKNP